jgi:Cupin
MDPLSDVLRSVRLNGAYFYLVEAGAPWSVSALAARELVPW